jgi:type III secretion system-like peptide-binding chaperone
VCIAMELFAEELTAKQISCACGLITFAADHWDDELKRTFGGETFFEGSSADDAPNATASGEADPAPEADARPGGYL